jgi:peptidoglycan pentaglycine glycine transferase (the first glycine)
VRVFESSYSPAEVEEFLKLYGELARRKEFLADSPVYVRSVLRWLATDRSRGALLLAEQNQSVLGGTVVVRAGKRCWYIWGATVKGEQANAGHLLQWHAIRWAKEHGCSEYDFGGFAENATSGPALFKKGFGGGMVTFVPAHRKILNNTKYQLLRLIYAIRDTGFE